jgi:peptide/nickel transport system substrate-binding protein
MTEDGTRDRVLRIGLNRQINRRMFLAFSATATLGLLGACERADDDADEEDVAAAEPDEDDDSDDEEADEEEDLTEEDDVDDTGDGIQLQEFDDPEPGPPVGDKPEELVMAWGTSQFHNHGVDPQRHCGSIAESQLRHIYEPLVDFDRDLETMVPILATDWERIDDLTMQFSLREGVSFHNGEEFNAEAVRYSVLRPLQDETAGDCRSIWANIDDVEVIDNLTVHVKTVAPDPGLLSRMAGIHMNIIAPEWADENPDAIAAEALGGTGPYKFVSWAPEEDLVVEANEDYWGDVPSIPRVRMRTIVEPATRVAALRAGEVHVAKDIPYEEIQGINNDGVARVLRVAQSRVPFYFITVEEEPYDDPRVRQAINYAANVDGVIDSILLGHGQRVSTVMAAWDFAFDHTLAPYPHDPERARELLEEAGYPDGIDIDIWFIEGRYPKDREVAEAMCSEMAAANIRCTPQLREAGTMGELQRAKETPGLVFASWGNIWFDPDFSLIPLFGCQEAENRGFDYTRPYGCNPELEEVMQAARVELDVQRRTELYAEAQRIIYEDAAALFMYQVVDSWGVNNWVRWSPRGDEQAWAYEMEWNE